MAAFSDWATLPEALAEQISRSRLLEVARRNLGISRTLPESAAMDAAIIEAINAPGNGPPVVTDDAALALRFPAPNNDQLAVLKDTGYVKRWDQPTSKFLAVGLTHSAGPLISLFAKGAVGDGVHDDRQALADADAAAVAKGGAAEIDPGTFLVGSNITLSGRWRHLGGAFKLAAAVIVTIAGPYDAGLSKSFDTSAAGSKVLFVGGSVPYTRPQWWGVVGNETGSGAGTDDTAAWNAAVAGTPDGTVLRVPPNTKSKLTGSIVLTNRESLEISSGLYLGNDNAIGAPQFVWFGAAGGIMVDMQYCRFCTVQGIVFRPMGVAGTGVNLDGANGGQVGTACEVADCYFDNQFTTNPTWTAVYISKTTIVNHEWHKVTRCVAVLSDANNNQLKSTNGLGITIGAGTVAFSAPDVTQALLALTDQGRRIRGIDDAGVAWDRTIATINVGAQTGTLSGANFGTAVTGKMFVIGGADSGGNVLPLIGVFVHIGPSSNAKTIVVSKCQAGYGIHGIRCENGSFTSDHNDWHGMESNLRNDGATETCVSFKDNSEQSMRHWQMNGGTVSYVIDSGRFANQYNCPTDGYFVCGNGPYGIQVTNSRIETSGQAPGGKIFDLTNFSQGVLTVGPNNHYDSTNKPPATLAQLGVLKSAYGNNARPVIILGNRGFADPPGSGVWTQDVSWYTSGLGSAIFGSPLVQPAPNSAPVAATIGNSELGFFLDQANEQVKALARRSDGGLRTIGLGNVAADFITLTDAASITPNAQDARRQKLTATVGVGANRTFHAPPDGFAGAELEIIIVNGTAGAITTAWQPGDYHLTTAWVDPAAGKRRKIRFLHDGDGWFEDWRSTGDIT